jgi:ATP-dependent Clp protease protease subunit
MKIFTSLFLLFVTLFATVIPTTNAEKVIKLTEDNFVVLRGQINGQSSSKVITDLLSHKSKELYFFLITNGGSITSGLQIIQTLQALHETGVQVSCITNVGLSMGFVITQYCPTRYVMPSSILMQHQASLGVSGSYNQVQTYLSFITNMVDDIDEYQAKRMNMTSAKFKDMVRDDWWMIGNEAKKNNAADEVVYVTCDFKNQMQTESIDTIFGKVKITYSKCPVARDPHKIEFVGDFPLSAKEKILDELMMSNYIHKIMTTANSNTNDEFRTIMI